MVNVRKHNQHPHISELRLRVDKRKWPNMTADKIKEITKSILDGFAPPDGIKVETFTYGQHLPEKDGTNMLARGDFGFIDESNGFSVTATREKKEK